jgi:hypothetical protein
MNFGSYFQIAKNDGRGGFAKTFIFPGKGASQLAGVADVDGDGDKDLVAGACVYYARGPLLDAPTPATGLGNAWLDESNYALALRDVDRDGDVDFVSKLGDVTLNQADGTFVRRTAPQPNPVVPKGYVAGVPEFIGDFDNDGSPDIVVPLSQGTPPQFSHMGRFMNNGSGQFRYDGRAAAVGVRIGWLARFGDPRRVAFTDDLDGDGDVDLIATSDPGYDPKARTEIFWNDGSGTFTAGPIFVGERYHRAADFDGDGRKDLLLCTFYPGVLRVRLATGLATSPYGAAITLPGSTPVLLLGAVEIAEVNDDARPDLIVRSYDASRKKNEIHVWCNTTTTRGTASFARASLGFLGPVGRTNGNAFATDVDGDGKTDLVVSGLESPGMAMQIYRRKTGDGNVLRAADFDLPVGHALFDGWPADIDGDGDMDLVGSFAVRNLRFQGSAGGSVRQYGVGTAGQGGIVPVLGATGPVRVGETKTLRLSGVRGPATALLALGARPADLPNFPLPGLTFLVDPASLIILPWPITGQSYGRGAAAQSLPVYLPPSVRGLEAFEQVFVFDSAAPSGVSATNGLHVHVGN